MAITNETYFLTGLTKIPNLNQSDVELEFNSYIEDYEDEYLNKVLGVVLKGEFLAGLAVLPTVDQKWTDLLTGKVFEYDGVTYEWRGFNNAKKRSAIAYYVFYYFCKEHNISFTGLGTVLSNAENSNSISPYQHLVNVYYRMVQENRILEKFLLAYPDKYSSYCPNDVLTKSINIYGI